MIQAEPPESVEEDSKEGEYTARMNTLGKMASAIFLTLFWNLLNVTNRCAYKFYWIQKTTV